MINFLRSWRTISFALLFILAITFGALLFINKPIEIYEIGGGKYNILSNVEIDAVKQYGDQIYFQSAFDIAKQKRYSSLYNQDGLINSSQLAVALSSLYLDRENVSDIKFNTDIHIEHDLQNKLWVVKYATIAWSNQNAIIIIDEIDGAEILCLMPNGM